MRVLEIISGFAVEGPLGGIERFGIELAKAVDPTVVTPIVCGLWAYDTPYEYGWVDHLRERGIEAFIPADWNESAPYAAFWNAYRAMHQNPQPVDIIHSHCQFGDAIALLLARRWGAKKVVRTVHNEKEWGKRPLRKHIFTDRLFPRWFDAEIGINKMVCEQLDGRPWSTTPSTCIYNALNIGRFAHVTVNRAEKLQELGLPPDAQIVGTIGRLTAQKAIDLLLSAADLTLPAMPHCHFVVVGTGDLEAELHAQAAQLPYADNIHFLGARNDVEQLLHCFDLFVNSSRWEGLPTTIMESMASRTPVVATDVGGTAELVNNETGFCRRC